MSGIIRKFTKQLIISGNLVVSCCMLLLYLLPSAHQTNFWFINLFALSLPFFILIQAGFLIFWLIVKPKLSIIPVVTFLLCSKLIISLVGFHFPEKDTSVNNSLLRVATWNSHLFNFFEYKGTLDEQMIQKAKDLHAGIFTTQEFVFSLDTASPITLERVKKKLGFKYVIAANDRAFGVHTNIRTINEKYHPYCLALFTNYPIIRWQKVQSQKDYNHTFLWADLLINGDTIRIFNIHLQSMHFAKNDYEFIDNINEQDLDVVQRNSRNLIRKMKVGYILRANQANDVKAEIEKSPYPVIVCGDMNDVPNSYAYQTISANLKDAHVEKGWAIGRTFRYLSPTLRIDYILHSKVLQLQQIHIDRTPLSDHSPVIADFNLPQN